MTTFNVSNSIKIVCVCNDTKNGFCHRATVFVNGNKKCSSVVSYCNRTWESYKFKTVLERALIKSGVVPKENIDAVLDGWGENPSTNGMAGLNSLSMVMKMGSLMCPDKAEANDFKLRMLKAGLPQGALNLPDDFDSLPEAEKERRLNGVAEILGTTHF